MPFLAAALPVLAQELAGPDVTGFEESRSLGFRSLDGKSMIPFTGYEYIASWGMTGLEVPPRDLVEVTYPGEDGSQIDDITVGSRTWGIPLRITSDAGHREFLQNRAAVRRLFNHRGVDYRRHGGTFDVVATSFLGERALRSAYVSGWEGDWQQQRSGSYFETVPLVGKAVRPYWTGARWQTPRIMRPTGFPWFGQFPPVLSPSRTLGADLIVTVEGDASGYCRIDLAGYAPAVEITGPGLFVQIPGGLASGETATIETYPPLAGIYFNGVKNPTRVAPLRRFSAIDPGDQVFNIDLGVAGPDAWAEISGPTLWETPW